MKEKDHIEAYFKKYLEYYEESPNEDFWARVSPVIEVPKQKSNHRILWMLLLLFSLLLSGFLLGSIAWDRNLDIEKEEELIPIVMDDVLIDNPLDANNQSTKKEKRPIQEVERAVEQPQETQLIEEEQPSLVAEKKGIDTPPQIAKFEDHEVVGVFTTTIGDVSKIQSPELKLLTDKIARLDYVAPELPKPRQRRPLTIQPYVSVNSYPVHRATYIGLIKQSFTGENLGLAQENMALHFNFGISTGIILNKQFDLQLGFNQDYRQIGHVWSINRNLNEQEIAILFDGVPINLDFTRDFYYDEFEGRLKITPKGSEIEAGERIFIIDAQRKVQVTKWNVAAIYKLDVNDIIRLIPKIGISKTSAKFKNYNKIAIKERLLDVNQQMLESPLNIEFSQISTDEEFKLETIEGMIGFQTEFPLNKKRNWMLVPMVETWFEIVPMVDRHDVRVFRNTLSTGLSLRHQLQ